MKSITATEARRAFSRILTEAAAGKEFLITRRGRPIARLEPVIANATSRKREQVAARMLRRMRKGAHLGLSWVSRDELHER